MHMDAGRLREEITIERPVATDDDTGGQALDYRTWRVVRAQVTPTSGSERIEAMALHGIRPYRIVIRALDVETTDRVRWKGKTLEIRGVGFLDRHQRWTEIVAEEVKGV